MKIEKMNDHQIRCTLTSEDLATRNIKLSELAYGSEKTRALFRDMMQQAAMDFGFEAEDIPLMVEAIPLSSEKIVVIITKVESPDELDTRFSNFTQFETEEDESDDGLPLDLDADSIDTSEVDDTATQFLQLLQRLRQEQNASKTEEKENENGEKEVVEVSPAKDKVKINKRPVSLSDPEPLWMKHPNSCTDEEYKEFYRKVFMDYKEPLFWIHLNVDYPFNLTGILYFSSYISL